MLMKGLAAFIELGDLEVQGAHITTAESCICAASLGTSGDPRHGPP